MADGAREGDGISDTQPTNTRNRDADISIDSLSDGRPRIICHVRARVWTWLRPSVLETTCDSVYRARPQGRAPTVLPRYSQLRNAAQLRFSAPLVCGRPAHHDLGSHRAAEALLMIHDHVRAAYQALTRDFAVRGLASGLRYGMHATLRRNHRAS